MQSTKYIYSLCLFLGIFFSVTALSAATLKKVLILDFTNIDQKKNYQYLEASITDAVKKNLKEKFAFQETRKRKWQEVAKTNYIFKQDYYTQTAALNLGLLAKQDIVISGGYRIGFRSQGPGVRKKKSLTPKSQSLTTIFTQVRILDISKRRVIAKFTIEGKADSSIFKSVEKIAERISKEAKAILPDKKEWAKKGLAGGEPGLPIFENYTIGIRAGGGLYSSGYSNKVKADLPALSFLVRANMPVVWEKLAFEIDLTWLKHSPIAGKNIPLDSLAVSTTNYISGGFFVLDFALTESFGLHPKIGAGYVMQSTSVTGSRNNNVNNGFIFVGAGVDLSYALNRNSFAILSLQNYTELERGTVTLLNTVSLGVNLKI